MRKRWIISMVAALLGAVTFALTACGGAAQEGGEKAISALSASGMKREFSLGESFEAGNIIVTARYDDGTTATLSSEQYSVDASACDMFTAGEYDVVVGVEGASARCSYTISVAPLPFEGEYLVVQHAPELFHIGDAFRSNGLQVTLCGARTDEARVLAASEYEVDSSAYNASEEGSYPIRVSMKGSKISAQYTVKVRKDYSKSFKLLAIGNSFSDDATQYLYDVAKAYGVQDVIVGNLYVGGCTLSQHKSYAQNNQAVYDYRKNTTGSIITKPAYRLLDALREEEWDIICLQQASQESGQSATYNSDLTFMLNYIEQNKTNEAAQVAWHMTWAYQQNSTHWAFPVYERDQRVMYESIVNAVKTNVLTNDAFDHVLPVGTAIQNARTSRLGDTLTRDGYHLTLDTGRMIAALTWFTEITGHDPNALPVSVLPASSASVEDVIKESVSAALRYPFSVTPFAFEGGTQPDLSDYTKLKTDFTAGYWEAKRSDALITEGERVQQFAATAQRFTCETLPVGSVIVLQEGWRFRAEAWADELSFARPYNVLRGYTVVDESWWENFTHRAFNLSKVTGEPVTAEEAAGAFAIYVPKAVNYK